MVLYIREERKLRVFKWGLLRNLFGPKTGEVTGDWRKLHNEELCDVYFLAHVVWVMKSRERTEGAGHVWGE